MPYTTYTTMKQNKRNEKQKFLRLLIYENRKTYLLNNAYISLIPDKCNKLKNLKNHLIKVIHFYKTFTDNNNHLIVTIENKNILLRNAIDLRNSFIAIHNTTETTTETEKDLLIIQNLINDFNIQINEIITTISTIKNSSDYNHVLTFPYYVTSINAYIKKIDITIKKYWNDLNNNKKRFIEKITTFDIMQFLNNKINNNIKYCINNYLFYILHHHISTEKQNLLNNDAVYILNENKQQYINQKGKVVYLDIDEIIKSNAHSYSYIDNLINERVINKFSFWFLNKTL